MTLRWAPLIVLLPVLAAAGAVRADAGAGRDGLATLEDEQTSLFAQVSPSVVLLVREGASGSGFVVTRDGLVLTNAHVVGEASEVTVQLKDGRHGRGKVVARATGSLDLALVQMPFEGVRPIPAGAPSELRTGMFAATVGHGGGAAWTLSTGLVANPRPLGDGAPLLLAQMALRPGSSGGPLVDRRGRALGVVTAGTRDASGVTFAIRVEAALAAFPQLVSWDVASPGLVATAAAAAPAAGPVAAPTADEGRVVAFTRFAAGAPTTSAPAAMTVVWEARPAHRSASRPSPRAKPLRLRAAAGCARPELLASAASLPGAIVLASGGGPAGAAITGAIVARAVCR